MKARNWLFLASFLLMLKGAMDISIDFVQYLSLGLRYIPTAPAQMHRANVLCIIYGSYGVCLLIVGILVFPKQKDIKKQPMFTCLQTKEYCY